MFIPKSILPSLSIGRDAYEDLREELASVETERDVLRNELIAHKVMGDWLRMRVNSLEFERAALMERAYNIKLPTPQISKAPDPYDGPEMGSFSFDDLGDEVARKLGLQTYDE